MDTVSAKKRSWIMAQIKSAGNESTEGRLAKQFRNHAIKGWRRKSKLLGKPDFVFRRARVAVFVDGCFWHGCPTHCRLPTTRRAYWTNKIAKNMRRDRNIRAALRRGGWTVWRFWEHEIRSPSVEEKLRGLRRTIRVRSKKMNPRVGRQE